MKYSQRELLSEGFWDKFPNVKKAAELTKQVAKVAAPEIYDPVKKVWDWKTNVRSAVKEAGIPLVEKLKRWVQEQGRFPLTDPKKIGGYPDGKEHYGLRVAEKGVSVVDNSEVAGRVYRNPSAVVAYNPNDNTISWVNKPRSDSYVQIRKADGLKYYKFGNQDADGANDPIDVVQNNNQQQNTQQTI